MDTTRGVIYGLHPSEQPWDVRYVGQTINIPQRRLNQHRNEARTGLSHLPVHRWIAKHRPENIEMMVLEWDVPRENIDDRETYWISELDTFIGSNSRGLNLTADGRGSLLFNQSAKARRSSQRLTVQERSDARLVSTRPELTPMEVASEIRHRYINDIPKWNTSDLGREYMVDCHRVRRILRNEEYPDPNWTPVREWNRKPSYRASDLGHDTAREIRERWIRGGVTSGELAEEYEVSVATIRSVVENRTWRDPGYANNRMEDSMPAQVRGKISQTLKGRPKPPGFGKRGESSVSSKLRLVDVEEIISRLHRGDKGVDIAQDYGVTPSTISRIKKGCVWTDVPRPWEEN